MENRLACGRTAPKKGAFVGRELRRQVRKVVMGDRRVESFDPDEPGAGDGRGGLAYHFFERPLPAIRLADGSWPFDIERRDDACSASISVEGPLDPLVERLWATCLDVRPSRAVLGLSVGPGDLVAQASFRLELARTEDGMDASVHLSYSPRDERPDAMRSLLLALGLDVPARPSSPAAAAPGIERLAVLAGLPAELPFLLELSKGLDRLGWAAPEALTRARFQMADEPAAFMAWRDRVNALSGGWDVVFAGRYRDGFDPYADAPKPPAGEEYRYPVAVLVKGNRTTGDRPTIQIDAVHAADGSYLEVQSFEGPRMVRKYAELAGVKVELWDAPPAPRWSSSSQEPVATT